MNNLINKIKLNEEEFYKIFAKEINVNKDINFYYDERLSDMYDHNFFNVKSLKETDLELLNKTRKKYKLNHLKICSNNQFDFLIKNNKFEEEIDLTLLKSKFTKKSAKINEKLTFCHFSNKNFKDDFMALELKHYGEVFGASYSNRKVSRFIEIINENVGLDYIGVYLNNIYVAHCYVFNKFGVTCIDGLLVDEAYRHQGIATSLLYYISNYYKTPIFLHADVSDTPKDLYFNLGFKETSRTYNYLAKNIK